MREKITVCAWSRRERPLGCRARHQYGVLILCLARDCSSTSGCSLMRTMSVAELSRAYCSHLSWYASVDDETKRHCLTQPVSHSIDCQLCQQSAAMYYIFTSLPHPSFNVFVRFLLPERYQSMKWSHDCHWLITRNLGFHSPRVVTQAFVATTFFPPF